MVGREGRGVVPGGFGYWENSLEPGGDSAMFRHFVENLDQSFFKAACDYSRFDYISPAAERLWGRPAALLIEDPQRWLEWLHPEDRLKVMQFVAENWHKDSYSSEFRIVLPDGAVRWILARAFVSREAGRETFVMGYHQDITARKAAEARLQKSHDVYRSMLATTPDGFWVLDAEGFLVEANDAYVRLSGYSHDELCRMHVTDLEAQEDAVQTSAHIRRVIDNGTDRFESKHRRKDGSVWDVEVSAIYRATGEGSFYVFLRDISERNRTQSEIRASEQRFRDLVNTTDGIVWEADARTFQFTFVSEKAERLLGYPTTNWLDKGFWIEHLHPDDREWAPAFCASCTGRLEPHDFEYRFIARDGRTVWLKDIVTVVAENGSPRWLRGIMVDVTDMKESTQGLQLARQIFDTAGEAIFVSDLEGNLLDVNAEACRLAKYTREEMLRLRNVDIVAVEEVERIAPELDQCDRGAVLENRWLLRCSDDTTVPLDLVVQRMPGNRYLAIGRDLTEKEGTLRDLSRARDEAEAANLAKSRFLAAASHDLRQPIQAINLFQDALARTGLSEEQRRITDYLALSTKSLGDLLNALLDISKLDSGMLKPKPVSISAEAVLIRVSDTFEQLATEKRLRFKLFFPLRPVLLQTDPDLLHTLLANLVGNAIKYCDRGGILLSVRRRGNEALIQVWDTGIGIVPEHLSTIFEEYFQVENSVRDRSQGIGLGLAIVRRIARLLNSEVVCRSQSGRGSVFELRVPLAVSEIVLPYSADEPVTTGSGAVSRLAGRRVAIIDDDFMVAKAIELSLKPLGIQVLTYFSAEEALADPLCAAADFHVCDLRLPGINGIECVEALQERAKRTLFGVLLTGDTAPGRIEMMHTSGWPVLYKPVDLGLLLEVLAEQEMRVARRGANRLVANGSGD